MPQKLQQNQKLGLRSPRQRRARLKVELMLEATVRLLENGGMPALTTNAVAETGGVSVGTLYQYFPNKDAILDALAEREMAALAERVLAVIADADIAAPRDRVAAIVSAVTESYGARRRAQQLVMAHSLARTGGLLRPLLARSIDMLSEQPPGGPAEPIGRADAFVLTHGFAGVLRGMITADKDAPDREEIEAALTRWIVGMMGMRAAG